MFGYGLDKRLERLKKELTGSLDASYETSKKTQSIMESDLDSVRQALENS